jgi:uncharacterized protein involved in exopolysaccharide biosynthesis
MTSNPGAQAVPPAPPKEALDNAAADQFHQLATEILSRNSLVEIIQEPSLDLYREERQRMPMEDVILRMRREIRISPVPMLPSDSGPPLTARISFAYPDQEKAQEVLRRLVTRFTRLNAAVNRQRAVLWQEAYPPSDPPPPGGEVIVLDPASLPRPVSPDRLAFLAWGLAGGLLLGLVAATGKQRPKWTLQMAGFAAAGCALSAAVSFLLPDNYTSTAVMRFTPPIAPERLSAALAGIPAVEKFQQLQQEVLSRNSLADVIQKPSLDLYPKERAHKPIGEVVEKMRSRDVRIRRVSPETGTTFAFSISFSYTDRYKSSGVVRELVSRFMNLNVLAMRLQVRDRKPGDEVRTALEHKLGANLEVLDPASLPETPNGPNRLIYAAAGLAFGLLAGALTMRFRHRGPTLRPA